MSRLKKARVDVDQLYNDIENCVVTLDERLEQYESTAYDMEDDVTRSKVSNWRKTLADMKKHFQC